MGKKKTEQRMNEGDNAIATITERIEAGNTRLVHALHLMIELKDCIRDFSDADPLVGIAFNAIDGILSTIDAPPPSGVVPVDEFTRRARALCADLIDTSFDGDDVKDFVNQIAFLKAEARSLLTGESVAELRDDPRYREE